MNTRFLILLILGILSFVVPFSASVQAADTVSFPSCVSPVGNVIASFAEGVHGIPGSALVHVGSDTVYLQGDGNVMQCFCPENGAAGIQTNWMSAVQLSADEIAALIPQDWIYIVSGIAWGLSDHPYMAKNISYTCSAVGGGDDGDGGGGSGGGETEGSVLGTTKKVSRTTPTHVADPAIQGDEIAMLPAAGNSFWNILIAIFVAYL